MMMAESFNDSIVADCIAKYLELNNDVLQFHGNAKMVLMCSKVRPCTAA